MMHYPARAWSIRLRACAMPSVPVPPIMLTDVVARWRPLAAPGAESCPSVRTKPLMATGAPSQTSTMPRHAMPHRERCHPALACVCVRCMCVCACALRVYVCSMCLTVCTCVCTCVCASASVYCRLQVMTTRTTKMFPLPSCAPT